MASGSDAPTRDHIEMRAAEGHDRAPSAARRGSHEVRYSQMKLAQPEQSTMHPYLNQFLVMLRRNLTLAVRFKRSTLAQTLLAPILFTVLLGALQRLDIQRQRKETLHPIEYPLIGLQQCQGELRDSPCVTLMYAPKTPLSDLVMKTLVEKNTPRIGKALSLEANTVTDLKWTPTSQLGVVPVSNADFIYDYVVAHPNTTQFGVFFESELPNARYQIWYNSSQALNGTDIWDVQLLSLQRALDESLIAVANTQGAVSSPATVSGSVTNGTLNIRLKDWPKVAPKSVPDTLVSQLGSMFFFCSVMVIFISVLQNITTEKELKLRAAMEMMGLKASVYWTSTFLVQMLLVFVAALVTLIMGLICRFTIFINCDAFVLFLLFFLYGLAMVSFAFFITTFCSKSRVAVLVGMFVFVIGLLFQSFAFSSSFIGYIWFDAGTSPAFYYLLMHLPFFNFGKLFLDISLFTTGKYDVLTDTTTPGPGFQFSTLYQDIPSNFLPIYTVGGNPPAVPKPNTTLCLFLMNIAVYSVLTWYLDKVLPDDYGRRAPVLFFLDPAYWGFRRTGQDHSALDAFIEQNSALSKRPEFTVESEDSDVKAERTRVFDKALNVPVRIGNLRKVYRNNWWGKSKLDKVAVKSTCLTFEEGKLLALLGQNGAGKSTTMSILAGLTPPTAGDAYFYGLRVTKNMDQIREMLGICPQHDILFDELTPIEHIQLYGGLKNLSKAEIQRISKTRLEALSLWKVKDQPSGMFSGGMKRRLSVLISTIGDPRLIFLDEPTTGIDPLNRRKVWSFLEEFKQNRIVILTTHSMEEADILGDQIAVMAKGRLRALGSGIRLKNKYGAGYRISLTAHEENIAAAKDLVQKNVPEAHLEDDSAGALIYRVPTSFVDKVGSFVKILEGEEGSKLVESWGLSQPSLEEIFLRLIREAQGESQAVPS